MKRKVFLAATVVALSNSVYGGGDIVAPVEPMVEESQSMSASEWEFRLSPYGWFGGFKGDVAGIPGFPPTYVEISPSEALEDSELAVTAMFEGKKNGSGFFVDFMYSDLESKDAIAGALTLTSRTKTTIVSAAYMYELYNQDQSVIDAFGGVRYWKINSHLSLIGPGANHTESWVDPLVGMKGRTPLGDSQFFVSAGAAMGGFGLNSDLFYDVNVNLGYQWNDAIGTTVGYRLYDLDYENDGFVYDVKQEGWVVGLTWKF